MKIRFLLDEHIHGSIHRQLQFLNIDAVSCHQAGVRGARDQELLRESKTCQLTVVTHDSDFIALHQTNTDHGGILFIPPGKRTIRQIVERLKEISDYLEYNDVKGELYFL